jgi:hypothetical protein
VSLEQNLDKVIARYAELGGQLAQADVAASKDFVKLSKEYSDLTPVVEVINNLKNVKSEIDDLNALIEDPENDGEMKTMAEEELATLKEKLPVLEQDIKLLLLPKDEADDKNAILEVRGQIYFACINATPRSENGSSSRCTSMKRASAAIKRPLRRFQAVVCLPGLSLNPGFIAFSACPKQNRVGAFILRRRPLP